MLLTLFFAASVLAGPTSQETKCLQLLSRFDYVKPGVPKIYPSGAAALRGVYRTINGKEELFLWDGDSIWKVKNHIHPHELTDANPPTPGFYWIDHYSEVSKSKVWSLSKFQGKGDGRTDNKFPASAADKIVDDVITSAFTAAMTDKNSYDLKRLGDACKGVDTLNVPNPELSGNQRSTMGSIARHLAGTKIANPKLNEAETKSAASVANPEPSIAAPTAAPEAEQQEVNGEL